MKKNILYGLMCGVLCIACWYHVSWRKMIAMEGVEIDVGESGGEEVEWPEGQSPEELQLEAYEQELADPTEDTATAEETLNAINIDAVIADMEAALQSEDMTGFNAAAAQATEYYEAEAVVDPDEEIMAQVAEDLGSKFQPVEGPSDSSDTDSDGAGSETEQTYPDRLQAALDAITGDSSLSTILEVQTLLEEYGKIVDRSVVKETLKTFDTSDAKLDYLSSLQVDMQSMIDMLEAKIDELPDLGNVEYISDYLALLEGYSSGVAVEAAKINNSFFSKLSSFVSSIKSAVKSIFSSSKSSTSAIAEEQTMINNADSQLQSIVQVVPGLSSSVDTVVSRLSSSGERLADVAETSVVQQSLIDVLNSDVTGITEILEGSDGQLGLNDIVDQFGEVANQYQLVNDNLAAKISSRAVLVTGDGKYVIASYDGQSVVAAEGAQEFNTYFDYVFDMYTTDFPDVSVNQVYNAIFAPDGNRISITNLPSDLTQVTQEQIDQAFDIWSDSVDNQWPAELDSIRNAFNMLQNPASRAVYDAFLSDYTTILGGSSVDLLDVDATEQFTTQLNSGAVSKFAITDPTTIQSMFDMQNTVAQKLNQATSNFSTLQTAQNSLQTAQTNAETRLTTAQQQLDSGLFGS